MEPTLYRTFLYFFMHGPFALLVANLSPGRFKFSHTNVAYRNVKYRTLLCESPSSVFSFLHVNHFCHGISILDLVQKWPKKNSALFLPPATKLGQSYVFTRVCDSVHGGGGAIPACIAGGIPSCLAAGLQGCACYPSMPCSRFPGAGRLLGGGGLLRGVCCWGVAWWRPPPGRLLLRAVRILLECILIIKKIPKLSVRPKFRIYLFDNTIFFEFIYQITCLELPLCLPSSKRWHLSVRIIIK